MLLELAVCLDRHSTDHLQRRRWARRPEVMEGAVHIGAISGSEIREKVKLSFFGFSKHPHTGEVIGNAVTGWGSDLEVIDVVARIQPPEYELAMLSVRSQQLSVLAFEDGELEHHRETRSSIVVDVGGRFPQGIYIVPTEVRGQSPTAAVEVLGYTAQVHGEKPLQTRIFYPARSGTRVLEFGPTCLAPFR